MKSALLARVWERISLNSEIFNNDNEIRSHFKKTGPVKLPSTDFDEIGLDFNVLDLEDDIMDDQCMQYQQAIDTLCELSHTNGLSEIANTIDHAVNLAIEAYKTTNIS